MKQFVLIQRQSGGCDYTIGCGISITHLDAKTLEKARLEAIEVIGSSWRSNDERAISNAKILTVEATEDLTELLDIAAQERAEKKKAKAAKALEAKELAEYKRLKSKFG